MIFESLADLNDVTVRIGKPVSAPAGDKPVKIERSEGDLCRITHRRNRRISIFNLKGDMADALTAAAISRRC